MFVSKNTIKIIDHCTWLKDMVRSFPKTRWWTHKRDTSLEKSFVPRFFFKMQQIRNFKKYLQPLK